MAIETFYQGRSCTVTGCGFVGSHLVDGLLAAGAVVRVVTSRGAVHREHPRLTAVAADLSRPDECRRALDGAEYVFHAAGVVGAAGGGATALMAGIALNLTLTANVVHAAWQNGVGRLLLFSSSTAYPVVDHAVQEDECWNGPVYPGYHGYGWMRRYFERLGEFAARSSGLGVALVRPGALYGPRDNFDPRTGHVVAGLIRRAVESSDPLSVWGDGNDVRDLLHVRDFAEGCLRMLMLKADCDPINIGSGVGVATGELARRILAAAGRSPDEMELAPDRPRALPYRVLDTSKASDVLDFVPRIGLEEGLKETVDWCRMAFHNTNGPSTLSD